VTEEDLNASIYHSQKKKNDEQLKKRKMVCVCWEIQATLIVKTFSSMNLQVRVIFLSFWGMMIGALGDLRKV
jgi:hypothetical protein